MYKTRCILFVSDYITVFAHLTLTIDMINLTWMVSLVKNCFNLFWTSNLKNHNSILNHGMSFNFYLDNTQHSIITKNALKQSALAKMSDSNLCALPHQINVGWAALFFISTIDTHWGWIDLDATRNPIQVPQKGFEPSCHTPKIKCVTIRLSNSLTNGIIQVTWRLYFHS